eukprot:2289367-Pleurochrysis_carterae.AAC.2
MPEVGSGAADENIPGSRLLCAQSRLLCVPLQAERAMKLCDQRWLEISDNYALLLLDAVWATLLKHAADRNLDKIASQREAADRLAEARKLLRVSGGAEAEARAYTCLRACARTCTCSCACTCACM